MGTVEKQGEFIGQFGVLNPYRIWSHDDGCGVMRFQSLCEPRPAVFIGPGGNFFSFPPLSTFARTNDNTRYLFLRKTSRP
jgi:hypothetical protein